MLKNKKFVLTIIIIALLIKASLFLFMLIFAPEGKFQPDSTDYLNTAEVLARQGAFALEHNGALQYELLRTPGYPFFLAGLHYFLKIPLGGIALLQLLLTVLAAFITYQAALIINEKTAWLSAIIVLYSPAITIFSLQILADTLYLTLISLFMWAFILWLKNRELKLIILSGILLAFATYVRPVSFYLGWAMAVFIVYAHIRNRFWQTILQTLVFLIVVYGLLAIWQWRNYLHFHQFIFTNIQNNYSGLPIFKNYALNSGSFSKAAGPFLNYANAAWHCFLSLMTRPGSLKYFHCSTLTAIGKIFGYSFVVFWWVGFLVGLTKLRASIYYQLLIWVIAYFVIITIAVVARSSGARYLVPAIPIIAIISAAGWIRLKEFFLKH